MLLLIINFPFDVGYIIISSCMYSWLIQSIYDQDLLMKFMIFTCIVENYDICQFSKCTAYDFSNLCTFVFEDVNFMIKLRFKLILRFPK